MSAFYYFLCREVVLILWAPFPSFMGDLIVSVKAASQFFRYALYPNLTYSDDVDDKLDCLNQMTTFKEIQPSLCYYVESSSRKACNHFGWLSENFCKSYFLVKYFLLFYLYYSCLCTIYCIYFPMVTVIILFKIKLMEHFTNKENFA